MSDVADGKPAVPAPPLQSQLDLELLREKYSYKKFIWGSVVTAIVVALLPPLFQLASAVLEYTKGQRELTINRETAYQNYVKGFMDKAIDQDIELRIRLARYYSSVLEGQYKADWDAYRGLLEGDRERIKASIDMKERELYALMADREENEPDIRELERNLEWAYNEVGYTQRDRSVVVNPRVSEAGAGISSSWIEQNIVLVKVPELIGVTDFPQSGEIRLHRLAVGPFTNAIRDIKAAGLLDRIVEWGGSYANRNVRGTQRLSIHALGLAFDINWKSNRLGAPPIRAGIKGSVEELVPIFRKYGFKWGGESARPEAAHFELVTAPDGETLPKVTDF
ncbi:M15 family metallopeptidase [Rhizobium terrae]|uniref:M15 family metallopeptidase n=1 Tax=Rhizobium terrae TaxID=2171756 RepID=UPI000E3E8A1E|nr:M15 family metallopeptidase [Rhizobium terrae]